MGTDIYGWVEMKRSDEWVGVLPIEAFVRRYIHGFGSMFLYENDFQPIAQGRGLPDDMSEEAKRSSPEEYWGQTWAYWREIAAINWDEEFIAPSPSVYLYKRNANGDMLLKWHGYLHEMKDPPPLDFSQEGETDIGDTRYRIVHDLPFRRSETLHPGWQVIFKVMASLADRYWTGNEAIRIVVWFG
jgi:hypothetical protein